MRLIPLGGRVIVKPIIKDKKTESGIFIASNEEEKPEQGEVIFIDSIPGIVSLSNVKVGDKVVFRRYAPDEVKIGDETYLILAESDIMARIEE